MRLLGFGLARADSPTCPKATVPAAEAGPRPGGPVVGQMAAVRRTTRSPSTTSYFARATGIDWRTMNHYGCSLVWGHPQAPMGTRAIIEVIEELALRGGGRGCSPAAPRATRRWPWCVEVGDAVSL